MKKIIFINNAGFTLIELILYISIVTIMLSALIPFAWNVIGNGVKSGTEQEVYSQGRILSERIKMEIRRASGITSVSSTSINLINLPTSGLNPTIITFASNQVTISQAGGTAIRLHSSNTSVVPFTFTDYTSGDNKTKNIQFNFTIDDNYTSSSRDYQESVTFQSSAEIRSN